MITDLNELADAVHENAIDHGFHPVESIPIFIANQCNNLHGEVTELWDAFRAGKEEETCDKGEKLLELNLRVMTCQEEELADIIIRALDVSRRLQIPIVECINAKHEYNKTRPYRHGKKN